MRSRKILRVAVSTCVAACVRFELVCLKQHLLYGLLQLLALGRPCVLLYYFLETDLACVWGVYC